MEEAGFDERATVAGVRDLLDAATELMPSLWQSTFEGARWGCGPPRRTRCRSWAGPRNIRVVFTPPGTFETASCWRRSPAASMADLVLDNREDPVLAAASPQRFGEY
jgi:hypothetical protein